MTTKISKKLVSVNDQIHTSSMIYLTFFILVPNFFTVKLRLKTQVFQSINNYFFTKMKNYSVMVKPLILLKIFLFFPTKNYYCHHQ